MKNIESIFKELKINASHVQPIGNHEFNRHWVYKFTESNASKVIKIYYKPNRKEREINAFKVLSASGLPIPRIIDHGVLGDQSDYLIMAALPGLVMDKTKVDFETQVKIYEEMGDMLGRIHSIKNSEQEMDLRSSSYESVQKAKNLIGELPLERDFKKLFDKAFLEYTHLMESVDFKNVNLGFCHNDFDSRNILICDSKISGLIDFEISGFGYTENDLINLHRKVFTDNQVLEEAFFKGYQRNLALDMESYKARRRINLIRDIFENCSWSFKQAPKYFDENIEYLERLFKGQ